MTWLDRSPSRRWLAHHLLLGYSVDEITTLGPSYGVYGLDILADELQSFQNRVIRERTASTEAAVRRQRQLIALGRQHHYEAMANLAQNGQARRLVETLLLAGLTPSNIASELPLLQGREDAIRLLQLALMDSSLMSSSELQAYYRVIKHPDMYHFISVYGRGFDFAMWKLGMRIEYDHKHMVSVLAHEAGMRALETTALPPTESTAKSFSAYTQSYIALLEQQRESGSDVDRALLALKEFALRTNRTETPRLIDVTGGNDSISARAKK
jgi:hypothetical protein